jgi:hypothetical protein
VAENEGIRAGGFALWKGRAETGELFGGDGKADHLLNCCSWLAKKIMGETRKGSLLMTSTPPAGQARLSGSFLTTSAVLKIPWIEQALTLNW